MSYSIQTTGGDDHHVHSPGFSEEVPYTYDANGNRVQSAPASGHVHSDHAQEVSYTYDADGNRVMNISGNHVPHTALDVQQHQHQEWQQVPLQPVEPMEIGDQEKRDVSTADSGDQMPGGIVGLLTRFFESQFVWNCMEVSTIVFGIIGIITAWSAVAKLRLAESQLMDIEDNWKKVPYTSVKLVPSTASCPDGYLNSPVLTWPGSSPGCGCPALAQYGGNIQKSGSGSCNTNQTSAGCVAGSSALSVDLSSWKGTKLCFSTTGAEASATFSGFNQGVVRPNPPCPSGFHTCGVGDYDNDRTTCAPDAETSFAWPDASSSKGCPLTLISSTKALVGGTVQASQFSSQQTIGSFIGTSVSGIVYSAQKLFAAAGEDIVSNSLPIVELAPAFSPPCAPGDTQNMKYNGTSSVSSGQNNYPSGCNTSPDARWKNWDSITESDLLYENFALQEVCKSEMSRLNFNISDLASSSKSPDYFTSKLICGSTPYNFPCATTSGGASSCNKCGASDKVCLDAFCQSKCGAYLQFARSGDSGGFAKNNVNLYYRSEIYWKTTCPHTKQDVYNSDKIFTQLVIVQPVMASINTFGQIILMWIALKLLCAQFGWNCMNRIEEFVCMACASINPCFRGCDNANDPKNFQDIKEEEARTVPYIALGLRFAIFGPCIAAVIFASKIANFYKEVDKFGCTDSLSKDAFSNLAVTLPSVLQSDSTTLAMIVLQTIYPLSMFIFHKCYPPKR